ncbi:CheY chemotaxis protein or a CheY-like REC (receiver) domain [Rhodospirillales bacterium URHD0017]|nr:CheY chemotaxis protein or a CheY-like REC (receiver) domain [Rhodospirillales bacterium URHD0017]
MLAPRLLEGLKVLVVEDNLLLAEVTKLLLEDSGCQVVGPAGWLQRGLELAEQESLDGAILDINLHGEMSFPIAEVLSTRGVPFVFVTGYEGRSIVPMAYRSAPRLDKPVADERLIEVLVATFTGKPVNSDPQADMVLSAGHAAGERSLRAGKGAARGTRIRR